MEKPDFEKLAKHYVENNPDSEIRRMYGHHYRSFLAGANACQSRITALEQSNAELLKALKYSNEKTMQFYTKLNTLIDEDGLQELRSIMKNQLEALSNSSSTPQG